MEWRGHMEALKRLYNKKLVMLVLATVIIASTAVTINFISNDIKNSIRGALNPSVKLRIAVDRQEVDVGDPIKISVTVVQGRTEGIFIIFNDGEVRTIENPEVGKTYTLTHVYDSEGVYVIGAYPLESISAMLRLYPNVTTAMIKGATVKVKVVDKPPSVSISLKKSKIFDEPLTYAEDEPIEIRFSISDPDDPLENITYRITVGGQTYTDLSITTDFNDSGVYPVFFAAWDDQNKLNYTYTFIKVRNLEPVAAFHIEGDYEIIDGKIHVKENTTLVFNASDTIDTPSDLEELLYIWEIGDAVLSGQAVSYTFTKSGTYKVRLTVIDDDGARSTAEATVIVENVPPSVAIHGPSTLYEGQTHVFTANVTDTPADVPIIKYYWSFGAVGWVATLTPIENNVTEVWVKVEDDDDVTSKDSMDVITLNRPPIAFIYDAYVYTLFRVNISGEMWSRVEIRILEDNETLMGLNVTPEDIPENVTEFFTEKYLKLYLRKNYTITIVPVFENVTTDPWIRIKVLLKFIDNSSAYFDTYIFFIGGVPQYISVKIDNLYELRESNGSWLIWINPEQIAEDAPVTFEGYAFDFGLDRISINATLLTENVTRDPIEIEPEGWPVFKYFTVNFTVPSNATLLLEATDDDGGYFNQSYRILRIESPEWDIVPVSFSPLVDVLIPEYIFEGAKVNASVVVTDYYGAANYTVRWIMGDGHEYAGPISKFANVTHQYNYSGTYLVVCEVSESNITGLGFKVITVENVEPVVFIGKPDNATEGDTIRISASAMDTDEVRILIEMLGERYADRSASFTVPDEGVYDIIIYVADDSGFSAIIKTNITVFNREPALTSPEGFTVAEGCPIFLYASVDDVPADLLKMSYRWYIKDNFTWLISNGWEPFLDVVYYKLVNETLLVVEAPQIVFWSESDEYNATLVISDGTVESETKIRVEFYEVQPLILSTPFTYVGPSEKIEVSVCALDSFMDIGRLVYYWKINNIVIPEISRNHIGTLELNLAVEEYNKTKDWTLTITVSDGEINATSSTDLHVVIDNDNNGLPDDIPPWYLFPDHDNDLLPTILEKFIGTNPYVPDTDGDGLLDGVEYFGWDITVRLSSGLITIHVTSNPLSEDTDKDRVSDYVEYMNRTNPSARDTDADRLSDWYELKYGLLPTDWDTDKDTIGDGTEVRIFKTDPCSADTDMDALNDSVEIRVMKTNPKVADTDRDGILDGYEYVTVKRPIASYVEVRGRKTISWTIPCEYAIRGRAMLKLMVEAMSKGASSTFTIWVYVKHGWRTIKRVEPQSITVPADDAKALCIKLGEFRRTKNLRIVIVVSASGGRDLPPILKSITLEASAWLNPRSRDTDRDGIIDSLEVKGFQMDAFVLKTDPFDKDTDHDGWSDGYEKRIGVNPLSPDTDGDGVIDSNDLAPCGNALLQITLNYVSVEWDVYVEHKKGEVEWVLFVPVVHWTYSSWWESTDRPMTVWTVLTVGPTTWVARGINTGETAYYSDAYTFYFDIPDNAKSTTLHVDVMICENSFPSLTWWRSIRAHPSTISITLRPTHYWKYVTTGWTGRRYVTTTTSYGWLEEWKRHYYVKSKISFKYKVYTVPKATVFIVTDGGPVDVTEEWAIFHLECTSAYGPLPKGPVFVLVPKRVLVNTLLMARISRGEPVGALTGVEWALALSKIKPSRITLVFGLGKISGYTAYRAISEYLLKNATGHTAFKLAKTNFLGFPPEVSAAIGYRAPPEPPAWTYETFVPSEGTFAPALLCAIAKAGQFIYAGFVAMAYAFEALLNEAIRIGLEIMRIIFDAAKALMRMTLRAVAEAAAALLTLMLKGLYIALKNVGVPLRFNGTALMLAVVSKASRTAGTESWRLEITIGVSAGYHPNSGSLCRTSQWWPR